MITLYGETFSQSVILANYNEAVNVFCFSCGTALVTKPESKATLTAGFTV